MPHSSVLWFAPALFWESSHLISFYRDSALEVISLTNGEDTVISGSKQLSLHFVSTTTFQKEILQLLTNRNIQCFLRKNKFKYYNTEVYSLTSFLHNTINEKIVTKIKYSKPPPHKNGLLCTQHQYVFH